MRHYEFVPGPDWQKHIAAFWMLTIDAGREPAGMRIYADGCADLIYNAGESIAYFFPMAGAQQAIPLYPRRLYLGGTMTAYGVLKGEVGTLLTGIRFWPGGFYALFAQPMEPALDSTIEFPLDQLGTLMGQPENLAIRLNRWFDDRSTHGMLPKAGVYDFVYLRKRMYQSAGLISVETLADEMHVSQKTLERIFKKNVGIPPKEFLRIIRFQELLKRLRNKKGENHASVAKESLLQTAFELGYYDHAHLTKEFKKYSGLLPSELSNFYKTGLSDGQYF
ncbi:helix-turn-helix domain-containing protein [Spirosoma foliorum]|uniref:AraC family transcriptional regulator n=1 Tax=Spirosoma foliorum TaxID=2710596 RepID=A0A7G5GUF7_9BACT|nr:helix-turn-helix domain-containing protein [Spirosoma foliorum]QMW02499.1 AraC family transcriptional regulator [Spirosoma foliorum]